MSSLEMNKKAARGFIEAIASNDVVALVGLLDDEGWVQTMGSTLISGVLKKDDLRGFATKVLAAFPEGFSMKIHNVIGEGDHVAIEAESHAQHVSGKLYQNKFHFLFRLRNGKILEVREYLDTEHVTEVLCGGQRRPAA